MEAFTEMALPLADRVATRHILAGYFNIGDVILFGKWKNHKGKIVAWGKDKYGNPTVEIEPIPKGRKQNKIMGLYKFWRADVKEKALAEQAEKEIAGKVASIAERVVLRLTEADRNMTAGQLPKILKIIFGAVFLGPSKALAEKAIRDEDWDDLAKEIVRRPGWAGDLPAAIEAKFYADVKKHQSLRGFDAALEADSTVEFLKSRITKVLPHDAVLSDPVDITDLNGELEVRFEVWGEEADPDNYDEKANFNNEIDDAVTALTGPIRVTHKFERNDWGGNSFVYEFRGQWKYDAAALIKANMGTLVSDEAAKAAARVKS